MTGRRFISHSILISIIFVCSIATSCTKGITIPIGETKSQKLSGVVFTTTIKGVKLINNDEIPFMAPAYYDKRNDVIRGKTDDTTIKEFVLSEIDLVILSQNSEGDPITIFVKPQSIKKEADRKIWKTNSEYSFRPQSTLIFNKDGGRFDPQKRLITGHTMTGNYVEIDSDKVCLVTSRKRSLINTTVGLYSLTYLAVYIVDAWDIINDMIFDNAHK